ncbi:MAG: site-2 protease family protein [Desulfurococcaceae archaeon]
MNTNLYQSANSLHQKLKDILALFSKAGVSVVEFRDYRNFVDLVVDKPLSSQLFKELYNDLLNGYNVLMFQLRSDELPVIRLVPYLKQKSRLYNYRWILTITSIITVFLTGLGLSQGFHSEEIGKAIGANTGITAIIIDAVLYSTAFLVTLVSHEFGHLITSRKSGIEAEGPILLPAPPIQLGFIGTLGAVIFTKTPPPTRKDLAKLGILGPLMGIVVATLFGVIGLYLSPLIPLELAQQLIEAGKIAPVGVTSLGIYLLRFLSLESGVIIIHPILFVAYFVYLVTFLNLLPIGQLDGGHVVRSVLSAKAFRTISTLVPPVLVLVGSILHLSGANGLYFISIGFLSLILYFFIGKHGHPGVANQYDDSKCITCLLIYVILLALTLPIPLS